MILLGTPTAVAPLGTSCNTTAPAPTLQEHPKVMFPKTFAPEPITTASSTVGCLLPLLKLVPPRTTP